MLSQHKKTHLLIFPPLFPDSRFPELATPQLKAFASINGFHVEQIDLNAEFLNEIKSGTLYAETLSKLEREIEIIGKFIIEHSLLQPAILQKITETNPSRLIQLMLNSSTAYHYRVVKLLTQIFKLQPPSAIPEEIENWAGNFNEIYEKFFIRQLSRFHHIPPISAGISIQTIAQLGPSILLAKLLRQHFNVKNIIAGGPWVTGFFPLTHRIKWIFNHFDGLIPFEGEVPYLNFLKNIHGGRGVFPSGFIFMKDNRLLWKKPPSPIPIKKLPPPQFDELPLNKYVSKMLPVRTMRTCPWSRCAFCYHIFHSSAGLSNSTISVEKTINIVKHLKDKYKVDKFALANHSTPFSFLRKFARAILKERIKIRWLAIVRFENAINKSLLDMLSRSGCVELQFGLETISEEGLKKLSRPPVQMQTIERAIENLYQTDINTNIFVLNYPGQERGEFESTLQWCIERAGAIKTLTIQKFRLGINTIAFANPALLGIKTENKDVLWADPFNYPYEAQKEIPYNRFMAISKRYTLEFLKVQGKTVIYPWDEEEVFKNLTYYPFDWREVDLSMKRSS